MQALTNILRVIVVWLWTMIVGGPLIVAIYLRYWYACAWARAGRPAVLDRTLEANAYLAGWIAQNPWTGVMLPIVVPLPSCPYWLFPQH